MYKKQITNAISSIVTIIMQFDNSSRKCYAICWLRNALSNVFITRSNIDFCVTTTNQVPNYPGTLGTATVITEEFLSLRYISRNHAIMTFNPLSCNCKSLWEPKPIKLIDKTEYLCVITIHTQKSMIYNYKSNKQCLYK